MTRRNQELPEVSIRETFILKGQNYVILRFRENEGPNFAKSVQLAKKNMKEMLTLDDANKICKTEASHFLKILKPAEWTYIRDPNSEENSEAAYLGQLRGKGNLEVGRYGMARLSSPVLILKMFDEETASGLDNLIRAMNE